MKTFRHISNTSKMSYCQVLASGQMALENEYIYSLLKEVGQPLTSREISTRSGIERSSVTRSLNNLEKDKRVNGDMEAKCPLTNRIVKYYTTND